MVPVQRLVVNVCYFCTCVDVPLQLGLGKETHQQPKFPSKDISFLPLINSQDSSPIELRILSWESN